MITGMLLAAMPQAHAAMGTSADEIMNCSDQATKVVGALSDLTLTLIDSSGQQRVRQLSMATKLEPNGHDNMRLLRFISPADIKGTVTLLIEHGGQSDDMWIYLPALKKTRRLVADNKRDSFVGSDLTFGDLIGHQPSDWANTNLREEVIDGKPTWVIESSPRNAMIKTSSGYSKRLLWVEKQSCIPLRTDYWDDAGLSLKTVRTSRVEGMDVANKKYQFMHLEASNQQTGHKSILNYNKYTLSQKIDDSVFAPRSLDQ
ncbi:MAG: outer membrane lipoprotein-sorting protein [Alphaproteobacteria bacterium]|nr:outer membrane lipoprotein-sorting protein [Alphaproteobacteria bacterium]